MTWDEERVIAFDFETSGLLPEFALQPWRVATGKAWATSLVWARKRGNKIDIKGGLDPTPTMMREMLEEGLREGCRFVGWNTIFDISWLLAYGLKDLVMKAGWLDGMLLWRHLDIEPEYDTDRPNKKSYSLKTAVPEFLPAFAGYQEDVDYHSTDPAEMAKLHRYNVRDVLFTLRLAEKFYKQLKPSQLKAALIEAQCLPLVAEANLTGMLVDTVAANELGESLSDTASAEALRLMIYGVDEKTIRSPTKLAKVLFDDWKLPVLKENVGKKTGKTSRSTDKETLHELSFKDERVKAIQGYREALNNRTKFADTPLESARYNEDGRTHPAAIVFGTYSGRLTYSSKQGKNKDERQTGFALHQEKRGADFRRIILAPEGYDLVEFDASGQEFRWMAIASEDPVMLAMCLPGEDPHSFMGARVAMKDYQVLMAEVKAGTPEAKDERQLGKVANLSLQYRTSAPKLRSVARVQYGIPMELPEAQRTRSTYLQTYKRVPVYWEAQIAQTKRTGYVETFAGRRVRVEGDWNGSFGWSMGSTSINYRIQGTGADQKYLALAVLKNYLSEIDARFAWDLHDGIYFWIPKRHTQAAVRKMKPMLDGLPYKRAWGITPPVPLPWDCKVGPSWGDLKEIKIDG